MVSLCWAAIFVVLFQPLYEWLGTKIKSENMRALVITALIVLLIIGPATYLGVALVGEAISMFDYIRDWVDAGGMENLKSLEDNAIFGFISQNFFPDALVPPETNLSTDSLGLIPGGFLPGEGMEGAALAQFNLEEMVINAFKAVSMFALRQATNILANVGLLVFHFFLMVFFMFYFFRDGQSLFDRIKETFPMSPERADLTFRHLKTVIEGTMYGGIVVSLLQGFLGGLMFLIMGLPSPVFWGAFMAFLAFIPVIGPSLIYIPAGLILILSGSPIKGTLLIIIGTVIVSQFDNFLRPILVAGKTKMHTMLLFISIMGGVAKFGLLGIVLGPLIAAIFVTLFDLFRLKMIEGDKRIFQPAGTDSFGNISDENADSDQEIDKDEEDNL